MFNVGDKITNDITGTRGVIVSGTGPYEVSYASGIGLRRNQPENTLTLIPKKLRITREQKYQSACEELIAAGCEVFTHEQTLPVKFDLNREPDALKTLTDLALAEGTLIVWTSPTTHTCTVAHVATACNLSFEEAEVLVNRGSERVEEGGNRTVDGGSKFDLLLPNVPELAGLNVKLGLYFNPGGNYANPKVVKIGNTKLTDHLMRLGMRPTPRVSTEEKDDETGGV